MWFRMMRGFKIVYSKGIRVHSRIHKNQGSLMMGDKHNDECNAMWIRFMELLSDEEKTQIAGSPREFYEEVFRFFQAHTSYDKVVMHAFKQCLRWDNSFSFTASDQQNCQSTAFSYQYPSFSSLCYDVCRKLRFAKYSFQLFGLTKHDKFV
jgi:hypothetical protein